jgi:hypothetical protein
MASWGIFSWGEGAWGNQGALVEVNNPLDVAWGKQTWSYGSYGGSNNLPLSLSSVNIAIDNEIALTGLQLVALSPVITTSNLQNVSGTSDNILFTFRPGASSKVQYVGLGWNVVGQPTFIVTSVTLDPNDQYTGTITITGGTFVSGQFYAFESPNVNVTGTANLTLDTNLANLTLNSVDAFPIIFAPVTAPGTPTTWGANSWGSGSWAENIGLELSEGNVTIDVITPVNVIGQQLTTFLNSVSFTIDGSVELTGQQLTLSLGEETVTGTASVSLTGQLLTLSEGDVDAAPDADVTGIQLTTVLNNVDIDIAVAAVVTGQQLTTSLNNVTIDLNTPVNLTTNLATLSLGSVSNKIDVTVNVTGFTLTGTTAQLYVGAWAPVNTGQSINWTEVAA